MFTFLSNLIVWIILWACICTVGTIHQGSNVIPSDWDVLLWEKKNANRFHLGHSRFTMCTVVIAFTSNNIVIKKFLWTIQIRIQWVELWTNTISSYQQRECGGGGEKTSLSDLQRLRETLSMTLETFSCLQKTLIILNKEALIWPDRINNIYGNTQLLNNQIWIIDLNISLVLSIACYYHVKL